MANNSRQKRTPKSKTKTKLKVVDHINHNDNEFNDTIDHDNYYSTATKIMDHDDHNDDDLSDEYTIGDGDSDTIESLVDGDRYGTFLIHNQMTTKHTNTYTHKHAHKV
jgi:hypothetical protein